MPGRTPTYNHTPEQAARIDAALDHTTPINGGARVGVNNSTVVPDIHREIKVDAHIPSVPGLNRIVELTTVDPTDPDNTVPNFAEMIHREPTDFEAYSGRQPRGLLNLRSFILTHTVNRARVKAEEAEKDAVTTWHLTDTISRAAPSSHADIATDTSNGAVDEYTQAQTAAAGKRPYVADDLRPTTRRQRKTRDKIVEAKKEWREKGLERTRAHAVRQRDLSFRQSRSVKRHEKAHEEFLEPLHKDVKRHHKKQDRHAKKKAKLDAVNAAIEARW